MSERNEFTEYFKASTQYNDMTGEIAADGAESAPLSKIAEAAGVDTERYFPLHLSLGFGRGPEDKMFFNVTVVAAERGDGASTFDELDQKAKANGGSLPVTCIHARRLHPEELLRHLKRLDICLTHKSLLSQRIQLEAQSQFHLDP